ncbi:Asp23/Gls24 family envelope stress response protein [Nocardia rhizosphaerae]|uniref:Asp23/Gls24 family envelope stress response protein n=1 Tax=Nocardia rhizosphaerae TaxID=1691571 RepID=A0ABV8LA70_9NOCA
MTAAVELPGRTTVGERAVRRIAAAAAAEVDGVVPDVRVDAEVAGTSAGLRVRLPVRYPSPVARVAEQCRGHLIARVTELTGLAVPFVEIEVTALVAQTAQRRVR